jgi:tetratricopeptide (TPR) repeat protein
MTYAIGKPRESIAAMRRAVALDPSSPIAHTDLGYALLIARDLDASSIETAKSMELDPTLALNENNLAERLFVQGKYDSVLVVDHGKNPATILFRLAALRKKGDVTRAKLLQDTIAATLRAPDADPDGSRRAMFYSVIEKPDSAFYFIDRMIKTKSGVLFTAGLPCYDLFANLYTDPRWDLALKKTNTSRCQR